MDKETDYKKCLNVFRIGQYEKALEEFDCYEKTYNNELKSEEFVRLKLAQAKCLDAISKCSSQNATNLSARFISELDIYLEHLSRVDKAAISVPPTIEYFGLTINFYLLTFNSEIRSKTGYYFKRFSEAARPKISDKEFLECWLKELNNLRFSNDKASLNSNIILAGEELLQNIPAAGEGYLPLRVKVLNFLADTVHFSNFSENETGDMFKRVLLFLDESLRLSPNDCFARTFKDYIERLAFTMLQIKRFNHDTGNRQGSLLAIAEKILNSQDLSSQTYKDLLAIKSHAQLLVSTGNLVRHAYPGENDWKKVDIAVLLEEMLVQRNFKPEECLLKNGEPQAWSIIEGYTRVAFENLIKNSLEAMDRNQVGEDRRKLEIRVDYSVRKVIFRDHALGIDKNVGDIFQPYVSVKKDINIERGLGLTQVREAMKLQNFVGVSLADPQPQDGACFIMDFNKRRTT